MDTIQSEINRLTNEIEGVDAVCVYNLLSHSYLHLDTNFRGTQLLKEISRNSHLTSFEFMYMEKGDVRMFLKSTEENLVVVQLKPNTFVNNVLMEINLTTFCNSL